MIVHSAAPIPQAAPQKLILQPVGLPDTARIWVRRFPLVVHDTWHMAIYRGAPHTEPLVVDKVRKAAPRFDRLPGAKPGRTTVIFVHFGKFMHERKIEKFCRDNAGYKPIDPRVLLAHGESDGDFCRDIELSRVRVVALAGKIPDNGGLCVFTVHREDVPGALQRTLKLKLEPYAYGFGEEHVFGFEALH